PFFDVDVAAAERVPDATDALALELPPVVVTPACPGSEASMQLVSHEATGGREIRPTVDIGLGDPGQLGAERADLRPVWPDQDPASFDSPPVAGIADADADFDDLARLV